MGQALERSSSDPVVHNELGMLAFRENNFVESKKSFKFALSILSDENNGSSSELLEILHVNIAHASRKLHHFDEAIDHLKKALIIYPSRSSTLSCLGFTHHLRGKGNDIYDAITCYHKVGGFHFYL